MPPPLLPGCCGRQADTRHSLHLYQHAGWAMGGGFDGGVARRSSSADGGCVQKVCSACVPVGRSTMEEPCPANFPSLLLRPIGLCPPSILLCFLSGRTDSHFILDRHPRWPQVRCAVLCCAVAMLTGHAVLRCGTSWCRRLGLALNPGGSAELTCKTYSRFCRSLPRAGGSCQRMFGARLQVCASPWEHPR